MANPALIVCTKDTWIKVASAVTSGMVRKITKGVSYLHTYRVASDPTPSNITDAVKFLGDSIPISASAAIDVWIYAQGAAGKVRVDL